MIPMFNDFVRNFSVSVRRPASTRGLRRQNLRAIFASLGLIALAAIALAQDNPYPQAASVLQPQAYVSIAPVPRGHAFEIAVVAKISPGFHINAHEPSEEYLIPTKIMADLPPGIALVETSYPRGVMRAFRFSKTPLRVYEGSFTVKMKLRAQSAAPLGPKKIGLTIGYQACNQDACLPPTKIPATAELEIADVDTPVRPANPSIFSTAPAVKSPSQN
jgi:DsbC/DsbD-like thiol-disulfide interchange protein